MSTQAAIPDVRQSYDILAPYYDQLADDPDFDTWMALFLEFIGTWPPGTRLLDIGCATGRTSAAFAALGFDVTAYDLSPKMIELARVVHGASGVTFLTGDVTAPPDLDPFDVVVCFNEALADLGDEASLVRAFRGVHDQLTAGGIFVFDLSTLARHRTVISQPWVAEGADHFLAIRSDGPPPAADATTTCLIDWFVPDGDTWRRHSVRQIYRHFSDASTRRALAAAGLVPLRVCGRDGARLVEHVDEDHHSKIHYLAARPAEPAHTGRDERRR